MVNFGIALTIAGPIIMIIMDLIGAKKAWRYRVTDREKFNAIYKPYKFWGLVIWGVLTIIGVLCIRFA